MTERWQFRSRSPQPHGVTICYGTGPIRRRDHPDDATRLDHAIRVGALSRVLPGVYLPSELAGDLGHRLRAAMAWAPDAVVTGRTAAAQQFWPELAHDVIDLAVPRQRRARPDGFRLSQRTIPEHLVWRRDHVRYTSPALTAVDLCPVLGPEVIDRALFSRRVTPERLRSALRGCPDRDGNNARRAHILDARGNPWSVAERRTHRILDDADITGWAGNPRLRLGEAGDCYYPDILFGRQKLVIEVDGWTYHHDREAFESDHARYRAFALAGFTILPYTVRDLDRPAALVREVRAMLRRLAV